MDKYKLTVGLEVHAELSTLTKMFCACKNDADEKMPNVNICPICMGQPGTLPVINKEAVKSVLKVGAAVGGNLADFSEFDRKNYFYPDIPKGYQISQYKYPLVSGGELAGVKITRVHLEEDTGKSTHVGESSLVDFNRAGVPLMELVTEPVIKSAGEAAAFAKELQLLLQYLGVAEANMEKGEMRVEANISVSASDELGTKVEVKNLNSFRSVEKAIEYEVKRQTTLLENQEKVAQETRGWDEGKQATFSQRSKEDSHDYRYFPDPDLPKLKLSKHEEFSLNALLREMNETPAKKRERYLKYGLKKADIEFYIYNTSFSHLFEDASVSLDEKDFQLLSNYIVTDLAALGEKSKQISGANLAELITMISQNLLSSRAAKDLIPQMALNNESPKIIAEREGLLQKSDEASIRSIVDAIISENGAVVSEYKAGKVSALQFLVGQGMKASKGSANPEVLKQMLSDQLS